MQKWAVLLPPSVLHRPCRCHRTSGSKRGCRLASEEACDRFRPLVLYRRAVWWMGNDDQVRKGRNKKKKLWKPSSIICGGSHPGLQGKTASHSWHNFPLNPSFPLWNEKIKGTLCCIAVRSFRNLISMFTCAVHEDCWKLHKHWLQILSLVESLKDPGTTTTTKNNGKH